MSQNRREESVFERRRHFRVTLDAQVSMGVVAEKAPGDPAYQVRLRYADLVDSLLRLRQRAEPVLQEPISRGIDYLAALQEMVLESADGRMFLRRGVEVEVHNGAVSLSEGGVGFCAAPPCKLGDDVWLVVIAANDPSQRPIRSLAKLVRLEPARDGHYLGFKFIDLDDGARRHLVTQVMNSQREELRRRREAELDEELEEARA